jgi:polyhydroxybutyrate depolymerase
MRLARLLAALSIVAAALAGCSNGGWTRAACMKAKPAKPGVQELSLPSGGTTRRALLYVPKGYDGTKQYPLVFSWHGYGSTAQAQLDYSGLERVADDGRFLVVAPQGEGHPTRFNLGSGITGTTDDVQLASDLIDRVGHDLCLDARRVYSAGVSNGGGMSALLACRLGPRFAAIAMVALELHPSGCTAPTPAVLAIQGDADLVVPFHGGRVNCCGGWPIAAAGQTMQQWADQLHCRGHDVLRVSAHVRRRTWHGCEDGRQVVYYVVHGGGHAWPGAGGKGPLGPSTKEISASEIAWDFFAHFTS